MTTATESTAKVDLAASNGTKRRGRPPGSKNKPKETTATPTRTRSTKAAAPVKAATPTRAVSPKATAILVTNEGIEVLHADGTTESFSVAISGAPLFDRRK